MIVSASAGLGKSRTVATIAASTATRTRGIDTELGDVRLSGMKSCYPGLQSCAQLGGHAGAHWLADFATALVIRGSARRKSRSLRTNKAVARTARNPGTPRSR